MMPACLEQCIGGKLVLLLPFILFLVSHVSVEAKHLSHCLLLNQVLWQGARGEVEQPGFRLASAQWDASDGFTCYATSLAPNSSLKHQFRQTSNMDQEFPLKD